MAASAQDVIILFGDSITQAGWTEGGFGAHLANDYARKLDVLNRGLAGYNTDWAVPVLKQASYRSWIQCLAAQSHAAKIKILVVWFGANDACVESSSQHVPLPKFIANLKDMVSLIHSADPETRVILITPPPVNTHQRTADLSSRVTPLALDRTFEATRAYAEGVKEAAAASKVSVVDVWTALWTAAEEREEALSEYLSDGLHLRPEGYAVVYEALMKTIEQEHADLHYERIGYVFPVWTELATSGI